MPLIINKTLLSGINFWEGTCAPAQKGAKNFAFFVHPLGREEAIHFAQGDEKQTAKIRTFLSRPVRDGREGGVDSLFLRPVLQAMRLKAIGRITVAARGRVAEGVFLLVPYLPSDFLDPLKREEILATLVEGSHIAKTFGAHWLGMGAFTSIISGNGDWLRRQPDNELLLTSGSAGTAVGVKWGVFNGMRQIGLKPNQSTLVIAGGSGSVGRVVGLLLATKFQRTILVGRNEIKLNRTAAQLEGVGVDCGRLEIMTNLNAAVAEGDVVIMATNAADAQFLGLDASSFRSGSLVVDVARPHNILPTTVITRPDVLFVEGAVLSYPGSNDFFRFLGMGGPNHAFGCLTETMIWALSGEKLHRSVGPLLDLKTVQLLEKKMKRYGVKLTGFRMFDQPIQLINIADVRSARQKTRKIIMPSGIRLAPAP